MDTNYFDLIEPYLAGELDEAGKQAFEAQLATDELLQKELEAEKAVRGFILFDEEQRILGSFEELEKGFQKKRPLRVWYSAAAVILLLISISFYNYFSNSTPESSLILAQQFAEVQDNILPPKYLSSEPKNDSSFIAKVSFLFRNNDCIALQNLAQQHPDTIILQSLVGRCYIKNKDYPKAIAWYLTDNLDEEVQKEAPFFLGVAYGLNEDYTNACTQFEKISNNSNYYYQNRAKTLLESLPCKDN